MVIVIYYKLYTPHATMQRYMQIAVPEARHNTTMNAVCRHKYPYLYISFQPNISLQPTLLKTTVCSKQLYGWGYVFSLSCLYILTPSVSAF